MEPVSMIAKAFTPKKGVETFAIMEGDTGGAGGVVRVGLEGLGGFPVRLGLGLGADGPQPLPWPTL